MIFVCRPTKLPSVINKYAESLYKNKKPEYLLRPTSTNPG